MGDRDLTFFIGTAAGGIIHFTTYTYVNIHAGGNVNVVQNVPYESDLTRWHYIYYGYSKPEKEAYAFIEFHDRTVKVPFKNINHYLPNHIYMWVGRDKWHSTYSGRIAHLVFNGGKGAFRRDDYGVKKDPFNYQLGRDKFAGDDEMPPVDDERE
jgi:hypothetical protein